MVASLEDIELNLKQEEKSNLRATARKTIEAIVDSENYIERQAKVLATLKAIADFKSAKTILIYYPMLGEINLEPLLKEFSGSKQFALPRALGKGHMVLFAIDSFEGLSEERYGIRVPPSTNPYISKDSLDLIIVPGLMFDKKGYRLGRGGGYFDKLLAKTQAKTMGLCFKEQLVEKLPTEKHDLAMDFVLEV